MIRQSMDVQKPRVVIAVILFYLALVVGCRIGEHYRETQVRQPRGVTTDPAGRFRKSSPLRRQPGSLVVEELTR